LKVKFIASILLVIVASCNNYQSFSSRKYLPKFKKTNYNEEQVVVQQKKPEPLLESNHNLIIKSKIDSSALDSEPILLASLNDNNTTDKVQTKKSRYRNNDWKLYIHKIILPEEIPEEPINEDKKLSLFAKILYLALMLYFFFVIPLLIYLIEGKNTPRYKTSLKLLLIYLAFCVTWLFVLFFAFIFSFLLALFSFNFFIFSTILLVATIIFYALSLYLGIKTIIKN
jgi:hypothetical protein